MLCFQPAAGEKQFDRCLLQVRVQFPAHRGGFFGRNLGLEGNFLKGMHEGEENFWKGSGGEIPPCRGKNTVLKVPSKEDRRGQGRRRGGGGTLL